MDAQAEAEAPSVARTLGLPEPEDIWISEAHDPGQILVFQQTLTLWWVFERGRARRYPVGLGRQGLEFTGAATVARKAEWPSWRPTDSMIARDPGRYGPYADGMEGGPRNPLGARALYLYRNGRDTYYRIHGTPTPSSVGTYASAGCIRMINDQVIDLYERVPIGTSVSVIT